MDKITGTGLIISGPTGAGKDTIANILIDCYGFKKLTSYTTRTQRADDKPGDYNFLTKDEYFELLKNNKFINSDPIKYGGNYYGLKIDDLKDKLLKGDNVIMSLTDKTPFLVKNIFPNNIILIYLLPSSKNEILSRLKQRKMTEKEVKKRLKEDSEHFKFILMYDKIFINKEGSPYTTAAEVFEYFKKTLRQY